MTSQSESSILFTEQLWKVNDRKAQKQGVHKSVYWVKKRKPQEDGKIKGEKWYQSCSYEGDWNENVREGYGVMIYSNGNKYEGNWANNKREGHGTLWKLVNKSGEKYKRIYTGDWEEDKMSGQGTYFYPNEDRYDGSWFKGKKHGEGRMLYSNGDIYEGQWIEDMKEGYGTLTRATGDYFEGYWFRDMRHGQGSHYFAEKNKIYVGEWVDDVPKCGVLTEVEDDETVKESRPKYFTDQHKDMTYPSLELADPQEVLREAIYQVRVVEEDY